MKKRFISESIFVLVLLMISLYLITLTSGLSFLETNPSTTPGNGTYLKNSTTQYINCSGAVIYDLGTAGNNLTFRNASLYIANTTNMSQLTTYTLAYNQSNNTDSAGKSSTVNFMNYSGGGGTNNGTSNMSFAVTWKINETFLLPGTYIYNCMVALVDVGKISATFDNATSESKNWSTNKTVVMDWYMPNITAVSPVNSSGVDVDATWSGATTNFTVTADDENLVNCSLYGDFTGAWARNKTIDVNRNVQADVVQLTLDSNITGYRWAIKCDDKAGWYKYNTTLGYNVTTGIAIMPYNAYTLKVDAGAPTITLTPSASKTITLGATESIKCEQGDNAGIGAVTFTVGGVEQTCSEGQGKGTCTASYRASSTGAFEMKCVASDAFGNGNTKTITLTVQDNAATGPGDTGDTGGSPPITPTTETITTTTEPVTVQPFTDTPFTISVQGTTYPVEVTGVTGTTATITTGSSSNTYTIGESKEVDINNDGVNDLEVTLSDINLGRAVFSIKEVEVSIPGESGAEVGTEEETTAKKASTGVVVGIVAAIIIILAGLYYFTRKK